MKSLIENLKALDKKVYIIAGVAIVIVIAVVVALVISLGKDDSDQPDDGFESETVTDGNETEAETENETDVETKDYLDTEIETDVETDVETEVETDAETEVTPNTDAPYSSGDVSTTVTPPTTNPPVTQPPVTKPPVTTATPTVDIIGSGTSADPYLDIPDANMSVTTISIPASGSYYYGVSRIGGMIMSIHNANAYVIYEGTRYDAVNGVVTVEIANALASDFIHFQIGNKGAATTFTLKFASPTGTYANPTIVKALGGDLKVSLEEGNDIGHYYKYIAEKSGKVRFYMTATADSVMLVTNNRNSTQRTTESDGLTDEQGRAYIELDVEQGDELIINVGAKPNKRGKYPASEITWNGKFI